MVLLADACGVVIRGGENGLPGCPAKVTTPTRSPAPCNTWVALASGCPTKLGITNAWGCEADVTRRLIFGADTPLAWGSGLCDRTWSGVEPGICNWASAPMSRPRRRMLISAARWLWPSRLGIHDGLECSLVEAVTRFFLPEYLGCSSGVPLPSASHFLRRFFVLQEGSCPLGQALLLRWYGSRSAWQSAPRPTLPPAASMPTKRNEGKTSLPLIIAFLFWEKL